MLRDPALIPLSHQHHNGLAMCVLLRRALAADASAENLKQQARRIVDRFELELVNHFAIEEQVLFPLCGAIPVVAELIADHRKLEALVEDLRHEASAERIEAFCELLCSHIRREERELFEEVQKSLPKDVLQRAGLAIEERAVRICLE